MRDVWFHRDFRGYSGGHGKVFDYFGHVDSHPAFRARLHLTSESVPEDNPWLAAGIEPMPAWAPAADSVLFLGGMDWAAVPDGVSNTVVNIIQGVRHADPEGPLSGFLGRHAVRICTAPEIASAIVATGRPRGPVEVIQAALDLPRVDPVPRADGRVLVAAAKRPDLGRALAERLRHEGRDVDLCIDWCPRAEFLARLAAAERAVVLPLVREGVFLPGLEAMALGCATVVPDCVGNRGWLAPGVNALAPDTTVDALAAAVDALDDPALRARLVAGGTATVARHSPGEERRQVHALLDRLDALWST